jgi:predicted ATPase
MKLVSARVRLFRNIIDSGDVEFQPDVTCLVGKNEAGKSAFLHALYRLNPARPNVKFSVPEQYPAWLEKKHRQRGDVLEDVTPIGAIFELEKDDLDTLRSRFGMDVLKSNRVTISRNYQNDWFINSDSNEGAFVSNLVQSLALAKEIAAELNSVKTLKALTVEIAKLKGSEDEARQTAAANLETNLTDALKGDSLSTALAKALSGQVPKFFYYSEYSNLPSRIKIRELLSADPAVLSDDLLTARSLLQLAAAENDYIVNPDYERRKRELENVANALTQDVLQYWSQNPELRFVIDVSQEVVNTPKPNTLIVDELKFRMWDERHWLSLPLDERSTGFRWFCSFLAAFSQYEFKEDPIIILLDEPGLGLHARAQKDFLRFIDERLAKKRQVCYTTHSPFMVQPGKLERARIVEDRGKELGSQITGDILSTDSDTLFPLQGALGYDLVQHLFIGPNNLIVEGTSDFTYLTVISDSMPAGRARLDPKWSMVPVGGADLVPTFVALLGHHLDLTVVIDARREGVQKLTRLADQGYLAKKRIITIGEILSRKVADIEDLFTEGEYLQLYNAAFGKRLKESDLPPGTDSLVSRITRYEGVDQFEHGKPADVFLRRRDEFVPKLSKETTDNFEALFKRINETLGS